MAALSPPRHASGHDSIPSSHCGAAFRPPFEGLANALPGGGSKIAVSRASKRFIHHKYSHIGPFLLFCGPVTRVSRHVQVIHLACQAG